MITSRTIFRWNRESHGFLKIGWPQRGGGMTANPTSLAAAGVRFRPRDKHKMMFILTRRDCGRMLWRE